jgi:hypothetical protein
MAKKTIVRWGKFYVNRGLYLSRQRKSGKVERHLFKIFGAGKQLPEIAMSRRRLLRDPDATQSYILSSSRSTSGHGRFPSVSFRG